MPVDGASGLPSSLEADVPPAYRYWKARPEEDARAIRDALVLTEHFKRVAPVNGRLRRVTAKWELPDLEPAAPSEFAVEPRAEQAGLAAALAVLPPLFDGATSAPALKFAAALAKDEWAGLAGNLVCAFDEDAAEDLPPAALAARLAKHTGEFLVAYPDGAGVAALADVGVVFRLRAAPGMVFVSSVAPVGKADLSATADAPDPDIERAFRAFFRATNMSKQELEAWKVAPETEGFDKSKAPRIAELLGKTTFDTWTAADAKFAREVMAAIDAAKQEPGKNRMTKLRLLGFNPERSESARNDESAAALSKRAALHKVLRREAKILKAEGSEERMVFGIVLEPETVDAQNDIYSEEEVRTAAHLFMEEFGNTGLMHRALVNNIVKILESFVAPVEMTLAGTVIKRGTWLMAMRVRDDGLWRAVRDGDLTGFSIGGHALRKPTEDGASS